VQIWRGPHGRWILSPRGDQACWGLFEQDAQAALTWIAIDARAWQKLHESRGCYWSAAEFWPVGRSTAQLVEALRSDMREAPWSQRVTFGRQRRL
jgi:hypothetical protein